MANNKRVTFVVGQGFDKDGLPLVNVKPRMAHALEYVARTFGGYSVVRGVGGWINDKGVLVEETSATITVLTDKRADLCTDFARGLAETFNQESVLMTIESIDVMDFVSQN